MKTVKQLLTGKPQGATFSVRPDTTVHDAMKLMADRNVGALLVLEEDKLVGILSERDFARKMYQYERPPTQIPVNEVMTRQVIYVRPDHTNEDCMALMTDKRVRHLPVLENGRVLGVISIGDLVKDTISEQRFIIEQLEHYIHG